MVWQAGGACWPETPAHQQAAWGLADIYAHTCCCRDWAHLDGSVEEQESQGLDHDKIGRLLLVPLHSPERGAGHWVPSYQ